ncbi:MAG TPA: AAC(3) family N-acetyltransferase [Longimicrobiales bacterium]|nr:AAC(3) family N-acetyltransferase [Longimicrobiales bacterium]
MLRQVVNRVLDGRQKRALKAKINKVKQRVVNTLFRYDAERLKKSLSELGIRETDTVLVHANFEPDSGFQGTPLDLVDALAELVGNKGNLLMVSIPFRGSAYEYLEKDKVFNARKTMSMMGLVTEMFRRRPGTLRSLHPTHPVLAFGKDAEWLVAGHEDCLYACGAGSPFDKFRSLHGKILFFDVGFGAITFFHHVEDLLKDRVPFEIYHERRFSVKAIDADGQERVIESYVFNPALTRDAGKLETEMLRQGKIRKARIGNSRCLLVTADDVVACHTAMVEAGDFPYAV